MDTLTQALEKSIKDNREQLEAYIEKLENRIREDKSTLARARQSLATLDEIDSLVFDFDFNFDEFDEIDE